MSQDGLLVALSLSLHTFVQQQILSGSQHGHVLNVIRPSLLQLGRQQRGLLPVSCDRTIMLTSKTLHLCSCPLFDLAFNHYLLLRCAVHQFQRTHPRCQLIPVGDQAELKCSTTGLMLGMQSCDLGTQLVFELLLHAFDVRLVGFAQLRSITLEISDCTRVILFPHAYESFALHMPLFTTPSRISFVCILQRLHRCGVLRSQRLQACNSAFQSLRAHLFIADGGTLNPMCSVALTASESFSSLQSIFNVLHFGPELRILLTSTLQTSGKPFS
mmetsp:Transcript_65182/g.174819  ORF Transcript_65182/g.174819 Transcript_65182/m.174819 type:complete len:272 (-) Transcript_65182:1324-2139(-)